MLRGTKVPICHPDKLSGEICCLLGGHIWDIRKRTLGRIKPNLARGSSGQCSSSSLSRTDGGLSAPSADC